MARRRTGAKSHTPWLEPILLEPSQIVGTDKQLTKFLRSKFRQALSDQASSATDRCVYVIRMVGQFVVAYPDGRSPVLYIGRGTASQRVAAHLKNWVTDLTKLGSNVRIEIRICRPRRKRNDEFYKCVEADLLERFLSKYGCIPFFNSQRQGAFAAECKGTWYTDTDEKRFSAAIGIGRGNRPRWAIAPAPANRNYRVYHTG